MSALGPSWPDHRDAARSACRTRLRILAAASDLFGQGGYHETGVREIGASAAVDAALVSRYFGGKGRLFAAAMAFEVETALDPLTDGGGRLDRVARLMLACAFAPAEVKQMVVEAVRDVLDRDSCDEQAGWEDWLVGADACQTALTLMHSLHRGDPNECMSRRFYDCLERRRGGAGH